ncbi:uncharacterized protein LOC124316549 [Daphnia pulicaria]|uniref:uncharacterized protein LOC124316549 n=1 Tax=Daphnia pulicaria TaxID=35523 RepID=UPI001EEC2FAB|nr:uncharacterized protein LOC124316549 [Daphnia pulicaria]
MSTKLDSLVLLVTISALLWPTGHGQLWVKENDSSDFDIDHNQEPLLTRRIRQFSGPSTTKIADNISNGQPNQNHPPLTCHQCRSFEDGDQCIHLAVNSSIFNEPCGSQHTACMVKRFSYTENATSPLALWYIERNCSAKCEPGCLILGERTKLYACISCCKEKLCNIGNGAHHLIVDHHFAATIFLLWIFFKTEQRT